MVSCKGAHVGPALMLTCVRWYVASPLSSRQVEVLREARGCASTRPTINRGVLDRPPRAVARRYLGYGLALADLINEGNIGLIHAVQRFDPSRGVKVITYAVWWIRRGRGLYQCYLD